MISLELFKKLAPLVLAAVLIGGLSYWISSSSYKKGAQSVQTKWDAEKVSYKKAIDSLKADYDKLESKVRIDNQRNSDELAEKETAHAVALAQLNAEFSGRMQLAEQRASRYQRQAQGGAVEQANLARHAAELDRALEEGRRLVAELAATLRQRDDQLRAVSQQLVNDRKLLLDDSK